MKTIVKDAVKIFMAGFIMLVAGRELLIRFKALGFLFTCLMDTGIAYLLFNSIEREGDAGG